MENYFEAGLDSLRQKLLTMACHAETAVNQAVQALVQRDYDLAQRVKDPSLCTQPKPRRRDVACTFL